MIAPSRPATREPTLVMESAPSERASRQIHGFPFWLLPPSALAVEPQHHVPLEGRVDHDPVQRVL